MGREIPILMSGPLVRATLEGAKPEYARSYPAKTQTRRPIKCMSNREHNGKLLGDWGLSVPPHQYGDGDEKLWQWTGKQKPQAGDWVEEVQCDVDDSYMAPVKGLAAVGDRLWVRETFAIVHPCRDMETGYIDDIRQPTDIPKDNGGGFWVPWYRADWNGDDGADRGFKWAPSIHMPRWACRLVLPLVKVRIERVQSISEADAWAEGYGEHWQRRVKEAGADGPLGRPDARGWFAKVWSELYGTWAQNPWVVVYEWGQIEVNR